jgi:hypothetical protein
VKRESKKHFTPAQRDVVIYGMICFSLVLVLLQLWLLTATMNAFLGGDGSVVWPAAIASGVCFLLNTGLIVYLYGMERER